MELKGRVALVTGGGSGIGKAAAQRLASEGMTVCVLDINGEAAEEVADPLGGMALTCDVSDPEQVEAGFARCMKKLGSVDLALLNAGVTVRWSGDIGSLDLADYRRSIGVNLDGVVFGVVAAVRAMRSRQTGVPGTILATSSFAGLVPYHPDPVYTVGKHGVIGLIRSIAPNLAAEGIAVHAICPGITETGMLGNRRALIESIGVPVMVPEDIADAVVVAATAPMKATGSCWVVQSGTPAWAMEFARVPGPDNALNVPVKAPANRS
jgi:NAD(P)-dependent dehydrogenase (short-subunit alcohol dehydrogenase family)